MQIDGQATVDSNHNVSLRNLWIGFSGYDSIYQSEALSYVLIRTGWDLKFVLIQYLCMQ